MSRPILITGMPRSGSSWVGEIFSRGAGIRYSYEPFNSTWVPDIKGRLEHLEYVPPDIDSRIELEAIADRAFKGKQSLKQILRAACHRVIFNQMSDNPDWRFCRYEDICDDPQGQIAVLAEALELPLNDAMRNIIARKSVSHEEGRESTSRISSNMIEVWRTRLTASEIDKVTDIVSRFDLDLYAV